jgi:tetratricopeptide (TPR) repeat protein
MTFVNQIRAAAAVPLLEEAILIDPQFASAHIYAAHSYSNLNQFEKAAPHFEAAFQLAPGVSQRERLFILGSYYQRFKRDRRRAADHYEALVSLYPDDYWGINNLSFLYVGLRMPRERIEALERSLALRPNNNNNNQGFEELWMWYRFDRPDAIKARHYGEILRRLRAARVPSGRGLVGPGTDA